MEVISVYAVFGIVRCQILVNIVYNVDVVNLLLMRCIKNISQELQKFRYFKLNIMSA